MVCLPTQVTCGAIQRLWDWLRGSLFACALIFLPNVVSIFVSWVVQDTLFVVVRLEEHGICPSIPDDCGENHRVWFSGRETWTLGMLHFFHPPSLLAYR